MFSSLPGVEPEESSADVRSKAFPTPPLDRWLLICADVNEINAWEMFLIQGKTSCDKTHHLYADLKKKAKQAPVEAGDVPSPENTMRNSNSGQHTSAW